MAFEKLMYRVAGGTITGNLGGKLINFAARPGHGAAQPPPGEYDIHPPVNDPIYGLVAVMTPSGGLNAGLNKHKVAPSFLKEAPSGIKEAPSFLKEAPSGMKETPASAFHKVEPAMKGNLAPAMKVCSAPANKMDLAFTAKHAPADKWDVASGIKETKGTPSSSVFVLSSRPIMGQNSLVVMIGHADLMDALQAAGGASVTVL